MIKFSFSVLFLRCCSLLSVLGYGASLTSPCCDAETQKADV